MRYSPSFSLLICIPLILMTGCAAKKDIAPISKEPNVNQILAFKIEDMENSLNKLQEEVHLLRQEREKNEAMIRSLRMEHAETGVAITELRDHMHQIRGSIDMLRKDYSVAAARGGKRDDDTKDFRDRLEALSFKVSFIENFIGVGNKALTPDAPDKAKLLPPVTKEQAPPPAITKAEKPKPPVPAPAPAPAPKEKVPSPVITKTEKAKPPVPAPKEIGPPPEITREEKERLYASAFEIFKEGQHEKARLSFQNFLKLFPDSEYSDDAQFWIAETFYFENRFEIAILEYEKVIKNFPGSNMISSALLKLGLSFANIGEEARARSILQQVIKDFPHSTQARTARTKLTEIK